MIARLKLMSCRQDSRRAVLTALAIVLASFQAMPAAEGERVDGAVTAAGPAAAPLRAAEPQAVPQAEKYHWKESPDQAGVITATFVGGKGHEWLVSGGWRPDGSVILAGNVLGPTLELGLPAAVIGTDAPQPPESEPPKVDLGDRARPTVVWNLPAVTGFLVRCSPDLKKVLSVHRLPWTSGAITAALVDKSGAVYIAGKAGDSIGKLGGRQESLRVASPDFQRGACERTFLAKIAPDLTTCEWAMVLEGPSQAPELRWLRDGTLWLVAQDVRTLDASGKVLKSALVPGGPSRHRAVNPVGGQIARNASRGNWHTGRQPWKCPGVRICRPDGSDLYHLYEWDGRYVGLDNLHAVADTTVQNLIFDNDGNLLLYTWSDGGNEVMRYGAHDIRRPHGCAGLPFRWGGPTFNVVKLEGRDFHTIASTKWRAETRHGAGLARVSTMQLLADGSVCVAGTAGPWGAHETTASLLPDGPSGGNYVTVLSANLASARFGSLVGGAGEIDLGNGAWGAVSGLANGRIRHLLLTGAKRENEPNSLAPEAAQTPTRNAVQAAFGGGVLDGYAILLDVPDTASAAASTAPETFPRLSIESPGVGKGRGSVETCAEGAAFYFQSDYPKYTTADAEFRHAADAEACYAPSRSAAAKPFDPRSAPRWPNFMYGRSVSGEMKWQAGKLVGRATVACPHWLQTNGDQSRRVFGELLEGKPAADFPPMTFTLSGLSEQKALEVRTIDARGREVIKKITYADGKGRLELGGRVLERDVRCAIGFSAGSGKPDRAYPLSPELPGVAISCFFTLKGRDLGLTRLADEEIDVRISMRGTVEMAGGSAGKSK